MAKNLKYLIGITLFVSILLIATTTVKAANRLTYNDETQGIEWEYELNTDDKIVALKCNTTSIAGEVTIPSQINGKDVISLSDAGAFKDCIGITKITIPETITTIAKNAFQGCTSLKNVTIPNNVIEIGKSAFYGCTALNEITFPTNIIKIGEYAFYGCTALKNLVIPNTVTTIESNAFKKCSGLESLTLSESLTALNDGVFYGCKNLTSAIIPDSVTTIASKDYGSGSFQYCTNLEKVLIPDSVVNIEKYAFTECKNLTIYGHDGQASKQYAEEYEMPFDYIENWDNGEGKDVTSPTVERIEVAEGGQRDEVSDMYVVKTGTTLEINVIFSEVIEVSTMPTLTIQIGEGENIVLTEGTLGNKMITYTYTVKETDKGIIKAVDFSGGEVKDLAGNVATLSCPELSNYSLARPIPVYANGTVTDLEEPGQSDDENETPTPDIDNPNGEDKKPAEEQGKDDTISKEKLPNAGKATVFYALVAIMAVGIVSFIKVKKYKEI